MHDYARHVTATCMEREAVRNLQHAAKAKVLRGGRDRKPGIGVTSQVNCSAETLFKESDFTLQNALHTALMQDASRTLDGSVPVARVVPGLGFCLFGSLH